MAVPSFHPLIIPAHSITFYILTRSGRGDHKVEAEPELLSKIKMLLNITEVTGQDILVLSVFTGGFPGKSLNLFGQTQNIITRIWG